VVFGGHALPMPEHAPSGLQGDVVLGIRPSAFSESEAVDLPSMQVEVALVEELGPEAHLLFNVRAPRVTSEDVLAASSEAGDALGPSLLLTDEDSTQFTAAVDSATKATAGSRVSLTVDPREFHFFDPTTGSSLLAESAG
jgi:multiple sugar transport system ATP-binding protein